MSQEIFMNWNQKRTDADGRGRTRTDADGRGRTRTDADGRGRTRTFLNLFSFNIFFFFLRFCCCWHTLIYGANWNETSESDRFGQPPPPPTHHDLMKIYWVYHPDSTTTLAQRVGMVAVGTTTLAQRRHGRRRHNYGGATSFSQRWANIFLSTICQRCRPCWKKIRKYLFFDFLRGPLFSRCQIQN